AHLTRDLVHIEVASTSHGAGRAKGALKSASGLRGNTECEALSFGDRHRFDRLAVAQTKKEFLRAVFRLLPREHRQTRDLELLRELLAQLLRQGRHLFEAA